MKSHITRDIKGCSASSLQIILVIYNALNVLSFRHEGLPENFDDIPNVNVYEAPGEKGGDWRQYLEDKGQAWIITPLHYSSGTGSRYIRKASGGGRWDDRTGPLPLKKNVDAYWEKRKYRLETKEGTGLPTYTMFEYSPAQDKPTHALCRITVDNKNIASSQKREGKEIDHTDSNNGDKRKTSQSQESMQQDNKNNVHGRPLSSSQQRKGKEIDHGNKGHKGGNFQNTTVDYNQKYLERKLRELRKHHSYADICKVLDEIEKLPAASPKEHSTEAPVSNTRKCDRCSCTNTMEAGTSTQGQEQVKVEMLESNSYEGDTTNLHDDTYRNCIEFGEQSSHHGNCNEKNAEQGSNPINLAYFAESWIFQELCNSDDHEMAEQNAVVQEPNQLSHNFNENSTVAMDYQNRIEPYPSTSNFATTEGRLDHQMVEPNAHFQGPKLYHNINGNSIEPVLNNSHLLNWNRNISAPGPSTSNYSAFMGGSDEQKFEQNVQDPYNFNANLTEPTENGWYLPFYYAPTVPPITDQGTCNAIEEHQFALCNTQHGQMFQSDAYVLESNNSSYNFKMISTEPTEKGNHLPIYNQITIAPGLDTNNNATTEYKDMDWINNMV